jgi:hypothetical protein
MEPSLSEVIRNNTEEIENLVSFIDDVKYAVESYNRFIVKN